MADDLTWLHAGIPRMGGRLCARFSMFLCPMRRYSSTADAVMMVACARARRALSSPCPPRPPLLVHVSDPKHLCYFRATVPASERLGAVQPDAPGARVPGRPLPRCCLSPAVSLSPRYLSLFLYPLYFRSIPITPSISTSLPGSPIPPFSMSRPVHRSIWRRMKKKRWDRSVEPLQ